MTLVRLAVLLAEEVPSFSDLRSLGVIALAAFLGAGAQYRWGTTPCRSDKDNERTERLAAHEREREAYAVTVPLLTQLTTTLPAVIDALRQKPTP